MSKKAKSADKSPKPPTLKDVARQLAAARKRLADAEARQEKIMGELAAVIAEIFDADLEVAESEADFEELAIAQARKRFGVPEEAPEPAESLKVTFSGVTCPCPRDFTFSIAKPDFELQRELEANRYARGLSK